MHKIKYFKINLILIVLVLLPLLFSFSVYAKDEEILTGDIEIIVSVNEKAQENVKVTIYQISEVVNNSTYEMKYLDEFNDFKTGKNDKYYYCDLEQFILNHNISGIEGITNKNGSIVFEDLELGEYYIKIDDFIYNNETYESEKYSAKLPSYIDGKYQFHLVSSPKSFIRLDSGGVCDKSSDDKDFDEKLPFTGSFNYLIPVFVIIGIAFILMYLFLIRKIKIKKFFSVIILQVGVLSMLLACSIVGIDLYNNHLANKNSDLVLPLLDDEINKNAFSENDWKNEFASLTIDKIVYVGILKIDDLNITLPVAREWSNFNSRYAPCLYKSNNSNKMIIAAHGINSLFGNLYNAEIGQRVIYMDLNGNEYVYEIDKIEIIDDEDVDKMVNTDYELTLFTCVSDNSARLTVRCKRIY